MLFQILDDFKKMFSEIKNDIKNIYFDKINENIKFYFNINENILQQIKIVIRYLQKKFY